MEAHRGYKKKLGGAYWYQERANERKGATPPLICCPHGLKAGCPRFTLLHRLAAPKLKSGSLNSLLMIISAIRRLCRPLPLGKQ